MIAGMPWYVLVMGILGGAGLGGAFLAHVISLDSRSACLCYTEEGGPYGGAYLVECSRHTSNPGHESGDGCITS